MQPLPRAGMQVVSSPGRLGARFGPRMIATMVMAIVSVVFVTLSLMSTWWGMEMSMSTTYPTPTTAVMREDFQLGQICVWMSMPGVYPMSISVCISYQTLTSFTSLVPVSTNPKAVENMFWLTGLLMWIGLLMTILALVLLVLGGFWPKVGIAGIVCGIVASLLVVSAAIYLFAALPNTINAIGGGTSTTGLTGFFGSVSYDLAGTSVRGTYGGGLGWFCALVAFALLLVTSILGAAAIATVMPLGNIRRAAPSYYVLATPAQVGPQPAMITMERPVVWQQVAAPIPSAPATPAVGEKVKTVPSTAPTAKPEKPLTTRTCSNCGGSMPPEALVCASCGASVGQ